VDRRQFLRITGGSAAAAALAAWLAPGCARRAVGPANQASPDTSYGRRPMLLAIVPKDENDGYRRGTAIGGMLNHGGDEVLADLAGVDLVFSTADRLPQDAREAGAGEPWFVLLTRDGTAVTARAFTPTLPPEPAAFRRGDKSWEQIDADAQGRVDALAVSLHAFLVSNLPLTIVDATTRAADARARYVKKAPPGTHWANSSGCGMEIEGVRDPDAGMVACGMGMVPTVSRRFLHYYVRG
jgi:hypothetical protein